MENFHESTQKTLGLPGLPSEAALFSVVRPNPLGTEVVVMSGAIDGLSGRPSLLKRPLARKASFRMREWVKRSCSTRTARTSGLSTSDSMKEQIKHLRDGRLEEEEEEGEVEGSSRNTTVLAPVTKRAQKSRASSIDSRVTQWLDFYTGPPELGKSQSQPLPKPLPAAHPPSRHQRPGSHASADLRPEPPRALSSEGHGNPVQKDSGSKPLLHLPAQSKQPGTGTVVLEKKGGEESERDPEPATSSRSQQNTSSELGGPGFLPLLRFGTPPPTPDSSGCGAAKTHLGRDKGKGKEEDGALPLKSKGDGDATVTRDKAQSKTETDDWVRHTSTRQERIWLHINYRGEAPFLQAWGLDITKLADRIKGLAILRELIQAEGERKSVESAEAVIQGSTSPALAAS
ncbi:hypothetical protein C8A01DRAFT_19957 [Parachaetomium inaequale]|uniref:Uncharacterized protein n=1 Tax=Parachaetomium inaequale TaxID=2588326 RepID=A0AAN6PBP4_9PEZI|nr:hypothetical protein C8A01DRAFT_19957 [Parachaetomium inaequale]